MMVRGELKLSEYNDFKVCLELSLEVYKKFL